MAKVVMSFLDRSEEISNVSIPFAEPALVDTVGDSDTVADALVAAVDAVTLATLRKQSVTLLEQSFAAAIPASPYAQRELGLRLHLASAGGSKYTLTIPAPDLATLNVPAGSDFADLSAAPLSSLVTAIEANYVGKDGTAVTVNSAEVIGRNS